MSSARNPRILELARLTRRRVRRERGEHLVEGPHAVADALAAGVVVEVFLSEGVDTGLDLAGVDVTTVSDGVLAKLADTRTPQGVVALARTRRPALEEVLGGILTVVLAGVSDPGNAGTVIRTADAAGASGVVLTAGSVDAYAPKTLRSAAGSTYHLPVVDDVALDDVVRACRRRRIRTVCLDGSGTSSVFALEDSKEPIALFLGNEAHGTPAEVLAAVDDVVGIPLVGDAESLNVAAAAAIALYAAARARTLPTHTLPASDPLRGPLPG